MENQISQPTSQIFIANQDNYLKIKLIFGFIGILILGFILGFITKSFTTPKSIPLVSQKPSVDESQLPISISLLTNPIVKEWRGSVKGKVTKKDEHTFTLVDESNNSITITDLMATGDRWKISFFDKNNNGKESSLSAITVGNNLTGDFFVFKGGPNIPVGSMFIKE